MMLEPPCEPESSSRFSIRAATKGDTGVCSQIGLQLSGGSSSSAAAQSVSTSSREPQQISFNAQYQIRPPQRSGEQ
jgi:hypothetical protein